MWYSLGKSVGCQDSSFELLRHMSSDSYFRVVVNVRYISYYLYRFAMYMFMVLG